MIICDFFTLRNLFSNKVKVLFFLNITYFEKKINHLMITKHRMNEEYQNIEKTIWSFHFPLLNSPIKIAPLFEICSSDLPILKQIFYSSFPLLFVHSSLEENRITTNSRFTSSISIQSQLLGMRAAQRNENVREFKKSTFSKS